MIKLPIFLITVGVSGCGKSTWAKKQKDFTIVNPDSIRKEVTGEITNMTKDGEVWKIAKDRVIALLKDGKNVILDATNVTSKGRISFIKDLPPCEKKAKVFKENLDDCKARVQKDIESGVDRSKVPMDVIDRQYANFLSNLEELQKDGFTIYYESENNDNIRYNRIYT